MLSAPPRRAGVPPFIVGLGLALLAAAIAYLLAGGAGADGQDIGLALLFGTLAILALVGLVRRRGFSSTTRAAAAPPSAPGAGWPAGGPGAPTTWPPSGPAPAQRRGPRSAYPRLKRSGAGRLPSGSASNAAVAGTATGAAPADARLAPSRRSRAMIAMGALSSLLFLAATWGVDPGSGPDDEATYLVGAAIVAGGPSVIAGFVAGWRHVGQVRAALTSVLLGVGLGAGLGAAMVAYGENPAGTSPLAVLFGILVVMVPAAIVAFLSGLLVQRLLAGLGRVLRPAA
jgi:hypothetical protein